MNINDYTHYLRNRGNNLAQIRRQQSDAIINATWTGDPTYKRVYILTKDGWKWEDVKYQYHQSQSVAKDNVDYYLQFRPGVHYPIGSYVLIPDDTSTELNLSTSEIANPFTQPIERRTQWWLIVDRDNQNAYVRYNVLQCNWNFQWVYNGKIESIYAVVRSANSYTSGIWRAEMTITLDNLTGFWSPDTYSVYGDKLKELGLSDTRTIAHDQRFLLTTNDLDPKAYAVTKVVEVSPVGLFKFSLKQDEFNPKRDNVKLRVCDYYTNMGDIKFDVLEDNLADKEFSIVQMFINENEELIESEVGPSASVQIGNISYYQAKLGYDKVSAVWNIELLDPLDNFDEEETKRLEGLIKLTVYEDNIVAVKPSKANSLVGKRFKLTASQNNGNYKTSIEWEVEADAT